MRIKHLIIVFAILAVSCENGDLPANGNNETNNNDQNSITISEEVMNLSAPLFGTSWKLNKFVRDDGRIDYSWPINCTITFSNEPYNTDIYRLWVNGGKDPNDYCWWYVNRSGISYNVAHYGESQGLSYITIGAWISGGGSMHDARIVRRNSSELVITNNNGDTIYFTSISSPGGGNASSAPEIGYYDFTSTKNSITVQYRIFSGDVSSAYIYYGENTPKSAIKATISGKMIQATIKGLSSGTKYYVKCVASGSGGSTESDITPCMTLY